MQLNNYRKEITVGVISSTIILIFVQPLVDYLWKVIVNSSSLFWTALGDAIIRYTALEYDLITEHIIYFNAYLTVIIIFTGLLIRTKIARDKVKHNIERRNGKTQLRKPEDYDKIIQQYESLLLKNTRSLIITLLTTAILTIFMLVSIDAIAYRQKILNTQFKQTLNILAPYMTEQEAKIYKSRWALMRTVSDYKKITDDLKIVAQQNKIELPQ